MDTYYNDFGLDVKMISWTNTKYLEWRFGITQNFFPSVSIQTAEILLCSRNRIFNRNKWNKICDFKKLAMAGHWWHTP